MITVPHWSKSPQACPSPLRTSFFTCLFPASPLSCQKSSHTFMVPAAAIGFPTWRRHRWARARGALHRWPGPDDGTPSAAGSSAGTTLGSAVAAAAVANPEEEPDPRRAIVAAYLAMTDAAAGCGVGRQPDETASEYLHRLLGLAGAPQEPARRLTAIFERARYSTEVLGEDSRSLAIGCLSEIRLGIAPSR